MVKLRLDFIGSYGCSFLHTWVNGKRSKSFFGSFNIHQIHHLLGIGLIGGVIVAAGVVPIIASVVVSAVVAVIAGIVISTIVVIPAVVVIPIIASVVISLTLVSSII